MNQYEFSKSHRDLSRLELDKVEQALIGIGMPGMMVCKKHVLDEYRNYYAKDSMTACVRAEIFIEAHRADEIVKRLPAPCITV